MGAKNGMKEFSFYHNPRVSLHLAFPKPFLEELGGRKIQIHHRNLPTDPPEFLETARKGRKSRLLAHPKLELENCSCHLTIRTFVKVGDKKGPGINLRVTGAENYARILRTPLRPINAQPCAPVKSSPVPTELKLGHPVLDMNRNPMMKSTRASLHGREHPHTVHQTGLHSRAHHQLPQVRKRRAENSINQKDMDEEKTTLPEIISTTEGKMYIGAGGDPKTPGICYTLCKDGMGGIACDCDLLPIG
ncbi:unnamed protein product [Allacma fusca]|uniref:Uncharacterized protein n=1 Tax=Allacma fusca TaxID=39272 RepID=A0A8J2LDP4_9HEXA|nr:unnamed protein product [Allacma fusca]